MLAHGRQGALLGDPGNAVGELSAKLKQPGAKAPTIELALKDTQQAVLLVLVYSAVGG